ATFRAAPEAIGYPWVLFGVPRSERPVEVLTNTAYTSGYSSETRTPLWVAYRLDEDTPFEPAPRLSRFLRDERVADPVTHDDYTGSGYDRGHLAPSAPIGRRYGSDAQR